MVKKKTLNQLKKDLWKVFSLFIRNRDKWTCVTCGRQEEGQGMHAGHYVPKSRGLSVYFREDNVHAQCYSCNVGRNGNLDRYSLFMDYRYGIDKRKELDKISRQEFRPTRQWYEEKIKYYKCKI